MLQPVRQNVNKVQTAQAVSLPAPIQGWNVRESVANMDPTYAFLLDNWFPTTSDIVGRLGSAVHSTGLNDSHGNPAQVNSVLVYKPSAGAEKIFGCASQYIYDSTAVGAATIDVSGLSNANWQSINYSTLGGAYLMAVNGVDHLQLFDGSTWQTVTGTSSPFAITGVDTSTLSSINVHMNRIWFVQANSQLCWYLPFQSIGGAATQFNLTGVFQKGGFIVAMGTWTSDGGTGLADYAVFISSQGEVAVYQGTDPSGVDTWALLGVYNIGIPIGGPRCYKKYGSDILILTSDGVVPGSQAFSSGRTTEKIALTDVIQGAFANAVQNYGTQFGWEFTQFPLGNMLVVNVPVGVGSQVQYVMNTLTGAWCSFSGWPVNAFAIHNDDLYGGTLGAINQYWTGVSDLGANIISEVQPAWSYYGSRTQLKNFKLWQPVFEYDVPPTGITVGFDVDYKSVTPTSVLQNLPTGSGARYDIDKWDQAVYGGSETVYAPWLTANGYPGFAASPHILVNNQIGLLHLSSFNIAYASAGIL